MSGLHAQSKIKMCWHRPLRCSLKHRCDGLKLWSHGTTSQPAMSGERRLSWTLQHLPIDSPWWHHHDCSGQKRERGSEKRQRVGEKREWRRRRTMVAVAVGGSYDHEVIACCWSMGKGGRQPGQQIPHLHERDELLSRRTGDSITVPESELD